MCFPARGSFFDLHFNQEQDSPRVPRPISGASPSKKAAPSYRRKAVCGRVVVSDSKFSVKSALYRHSRESGNPGPQANQRLPPVQARGRLWTPASAGATITSSDCSLHFGSGTQKTAALFRRRLGERPREQFGEGRIGEIGRRPAGKALRLRQDFARESIRRRPIVRVGGRRIVDVRALKDDGNHRTAGVPPASALASLSQPSAPPLMPAPPLSRPRRATCGGG